MNISLRPATADDLELLDRMHTESMRPHVEKVYRWDPDFFRRAFTPSLIRVIVMDGVDIGMLSVVVEDGIVHLRQISIAAGWRDRGIGERIIAMVVGEAARAGMPVRLRVLRLNAAKRLYERLGFREIMETETHHIMQCEPFQEDQR